MKERFYPIIIGAYDEADKMSLWGRHKILRKGRSLYIIRLKHNAKRGDVIDDFSIDKDVAQVLCHIHFCRKEALEVFVKNAQEMLSNWESEDAE